MLPWLLVTAVCLTPGIGPLALFSTPVDESKLPPPATAKVEFVRDIKPIFENACFRCHGPEKPKGKFRLNDRAAALKGGSDGLDILPGQSAQSPLIHYVARLVEDKEMPPPGKGEPLTREQISLLRAWIDQGVDWPDSAATAESKMQFTVSPTIRWIGVQGDARKFREDWWMKDGASGGFESFKLRQKIGEDETLTLEGRALFDQSDYKITLTLEKNEFGFARAGFEQYRKYYDDSGGYYQPFGTPAFRLNRDLHLDIGKAWAEFGLTLPDWPQMVFGYEYHFKNGAKSSLQWGDSTQGGETRKIFPTAKGIDEKLHVIRFDLDHEWRGVRVENNFRAEFYDLATERKNVTAFAPPATTPGSFALVKERQRHFQGANAFRLERQFTDWLFASGGYFYSRLDADAAFRLNTINGAGAPLVGDLWSSQQILLAQETHVFNANTLLGPWEGLTFSAGVQSEWSHQEGLGNLNLDFGDAVAPPLFVQPVMVSANLDKNSVDEIFALRYTKIPHAVLFVETRFQQERIGQFEREAGTPVDYRDFLRNTIATSDLKDYRAGFTVSPWPRVSFNVQARHRDKQSNYLNLIDQGPAPFFGGGYSAFIRSRETVTDEVEAKLSWRATAWLKTAFTYKLTAMDFTTVTDPYIDPFSAALITPGGGILAGNYDAHVYSANAVITPWRRLYLSTTFSYSASRTRTAKNGNPSIVPYRGDTYSALTSGTFALNPTTDLSASYSFSRADYGQSNSADGLPLGLEYQRHAVLVGVAKRWKKELTTNLQYGFFQYTEPSGGGLNNYTAHGIFATLTKKWP